MTSIGRNVKKLRTEKGWTQIRLSIEAHVSQQAISFIESGRNEPSADMIRALSKALNVSTDEIIGEKAQKEKDFSQNEETLLRIFNQLNDAGQSMLIAQAEIILQQPAMRKKSSTSSEAI